jgi:hypothetical protein
VCRIVPGVERFDNSLLPAAVRTPLDYLAGPMRLNRFLHHCVPRLLLAFGAFGLASCATMVAAPVSNKPATDTATPAMMPAASPFATTAAAAKPAGSASAPAAGAATPPAPGQPPPFATVIKEAKEIKGLFTLWQKDEKVWIELKPEDFDKPFFFAPKLARGIGEKGIFGGSMRVPGSLLDDRIVEFRRLHNLVQLVAVNTEFIARDAKSPEARAVAAAFAPSLLSSAPVASGPHPERNTVLVDAGPLLLNDMLAIGPALQRAYRQGYSLEGRNTQFTQVRSKPDEVVFDIDAHFYTANIAVPQPGAPPAAPVPSVPRSLPDPRSMVLGVHIAIGKLPDTPMPPRVADARVGYFSTTVQDFSDDLARTPRQRYVNRWRLEKKDPAAALSEPVKPITFWLDRTIPLKYRNAIGRGVLAWNSAFERIGFKDALVVKVQPDDADFDTLDTDAASIRWMTNAQPSFGAIGPSQVDPRSGEILDADIGIESLSSRNVRALRSQILSGAGAMDWPTLMQSHDAPSASAGSSLPLSLRDLAACQYADFAAEQLSYALDVLEARGEIDPAGAEAQQFVLDYLTDTTMHEVGHTLGLRHNFRSSRVYTDEQLSDRDFTTANGVAGSVMEYAPINLPRPGRSGGIPFQTTLGPYDFWAIEYAYRPMAPGTTPEQEAEQLQHIAARSAEPGLAYGTDEDNFLGIDPESLHFDLGDDPVAFAAKRIDIARDVIARQESRTLKADADYAVLRRSINYAVRDAGRAAGILARQIGGIRTLRDHPGSGRDPLLPVPAAVQRQALEVLASGVLAADSFKLSPALQRKLAPDYNERVEALFGEGGDAAVATDYSIVGVVLGMQRALLAQLMSDGVAARLLDSEGKVDRVTGGKDGDSFRLSELYARLTREIWSELGTGADIAAPRRDLQREHVNRLAAALLQPTAASRADARSLLRAEARALLTRIQTASRKAGLSAEARAHLSDSADSLGLALEAKLQRAGA